MADDDILIKGKRPRDEDGEAHVGAPPPMLASGGDDFMKEKLTSYYKNLFPFTEMFRWLSYGKKEYFKQREFSYTIRSPKGEDIYIRYKCYDSAEEFKNATTQLAPVKIDIGAYFSKPPSQHANSVVPLVPLEKELVFDIDMDDYQPIKGCECTAKGQVCPKCWLFMRTATLVVNRVLRENFGFQHLLWVFSGRRGMHCWVADSRARKLTVDARAAVANFLSVLEITAQNKSGKTKALHPLHPTLRSIFDNILLPAFEQHIINDHRLFESPERWQAVLDLIPDVPFKETKEILNEKWTQDGSATTPLAKWKQLVATVAKLISDDFKAQEKKFKQKASAIPSPHIDIVFTYTWPRLDVAVSKGMNHLLKSPFCIHPSTKRVCVPVDPDTLEFDDAIHQGNTFKLEEVPTLDQVLAELSTTQTSASMAAHVRYLRDRFLKPLEAELLQERRAEPDMSF